MNALELSTTLIVAMALAAIFAIVVPPVAGWIARQKLNVTWRHFAIGAATFAVFQLFSRIPAVGLAQWALGDVLQESAALQWAWIVVLSLTAGLFEEGGRYAAFRWAMQDEEKTWDKAVMVGLGHGGIESMVLVGLSVGGTLIWLLLLTPEALEALPPEAMMQLEELAGQNPYTPLAGAFERAMSMLLHVALSVTVIQLFIRGGWKWLVGAIIVHALANGVVVSGLKIAGEHMSSFESVLVAEGMMLVIGMASLVWIIRFKPSNRAVAETG